MGKKLWGKDEPETQPETQPEQPQEQVQPLAPLADDTSALAAQSDKHAEMLRRGEKTTTTADSERGDQRPPDPVGELDKKSPEERIDFLRGWGQRTRLGGPRSADWEEFDAATKEKTEPQK